MRRLRIIGLAFGVALAMGSIVGPASAEGSKLAKRSKLLLTSGFHTPLSAGQEIVLATYTQVTLETNDGTLTCIPSGGPKGVSGLLGQLLTNDEKTDYAELEAPFGVLAGEPGCASSIPLGSNAALGLGVLGARLSLSSNGTAEIKKALGEGAAGEIRIGFDEDEFGNYVAECRYTYTKLKGTVMGGDPYGGFGGKLVEVYFTKQKLKLFRSFPEKACPTKATLTVPFESTDVPVGPESVLMGIFEEGLT